MVMGVAVIRPAIMVMIVGVPVTVVVLVHLRVFYAKDNRGEARKRKGVLALCIFVHSEAYSKTWRLQASGPYCWMVDTTSMIS
jgi:hypothetical protein